MVSRTLVLASSSPRRKELLERLGLKVQVRVPDIDEAREELEGHGQYVRRMALSKARSVAGTCGSGFVLGADTVGVIGDDLLGKPRDDDHAVAMLQRLSGRTHKVLTGVAVVCCADGNDDDHSWSGMAETDVRFAELPIKTIRSYIATGEGRDKAGSYAIQGLADPFVESIQGSWSNVVGLPSSLTVRLLHKAGFPLPVRLRIGRNGHDRLA